jgi:predicted porin
MSLSIGGYYQTSLEVRDEDDDSGDAGANLQTFGVYDDGEIQFTASTTLDNGIGVKVRIEYEADNQGGGNTIQDERWVEFSGGFGALKIGADDNVANAMQYQAPVAAYMMGVNTPTFAIPSSGGNQITSYPTTYINTGGDSQKIIWFSPRIAGFQLGLSYAPDQDINTGSTPQSDDDPGQQEDIISIGVNFVETFNDIDVAVSGGYIQGNLEANARTFSTTSTRGVVCGLECRVRRLHSWCQCSPPEQRHRQQRRQHHLGCRRHLFDGPIDRRLHLPPW